jgi:hypothetical protein
MDVNGDAIRTEKRLPRRPATGGRPVAVLVKGFLLVGSARICRGQRRFPESVPGRRGWTSMAVDCLRPVGSHDQQAAPLEGALLLYKRRVPKARSSHAVREPNI